MKVIIYTLLLPLVLTEYPSPRISRPFQYKIIPSIQTSIQLRQQISVPHTVYGPPPVPKSIESLDIRRPIKISVNTGKSFNQKQSFNIPKTSYGVPVLNEPKFVYSKPERNVAKSFSREPCYHNQNNNQLSTNILTENLLNQRLPTLNAGNFNQDFQNRPQIINQYIPAKPQVNFNGQPKFPNNNVNLNNQNSDNPNFKDVPVVIGTNTQENIDENLNQNQVSPNDNNPNDRLPNNFNPNTQNVGNMETPRIHYYLPSPVPPTSARPVIRRKTTTTTTSSPIEESEEEASENEENTRRPQVAIANAFAGLYYPQQPPQESRKLSSAQTEQSSRVQEVTQLQLVNPPYNTAYQLQAVQAYPQHIQPYYSINLPISSAWQK